MFDFQYEILMLTVKNPFQGYFVMVQNIAA